jgi:hypothetical protein
MNQKTDDAEDAGAERPDEHSEATSSTAVAPSETPRDESADTSDDAAPQAVPPKSGPGSRVAAILAGFAILLALAALAGVG